MISRSLLLLSATLLLPATAQAQQGGLDFFEQKIRPVLVKHCYECHSVDAQKAKKLKGDLFLDSRQGTHEGGENGPAVVPGDLKKSLLLNALRHQDFKMPPSGKLPKEVIADFEAWIKMGAPDPRDGKAVVVKKEIDVEAGRKYWAFQPLRPVTPPAVKTRNWAKTPLDHFILARLEAKGLTPNAIVGREKLIRRAYFDLWGLPPTPKEIDAFVQDVAPDAYEKLIDRLLDGTPYGERWARHWFDVVRFAESGGYEFDGDRPGAFHYRDFVIKALNQDMPYDEFVRLQIAGDQLRPDDFLAKTATGFLVAGPFPGQITAKTQERIRYDHLDDMASTLGNALLGLSMGCARCHDHKYDPIPQQDYYRLIAGLGRTDAAKPKLDPSPETYRKAKADFDQAHAPLAAALEKYQRETLPGKVRAWSQATLKQPAPAWLLLDAVTATGKAALKKLLDGALQATGKVEKGDAYTIVAHTQQQGITAVRLEALADAALPKMGPGRDPDGQFLLTNVTLTAAPLNGKGKPVAVKLKAARASFEAPGFPLAAALGTDKKKGWSVAGQAGKDHVAVFETATPVGFEGGTVLTLVLKFEGEGFGIGKARVAIGKTPPAALAGDAALQHAQEVRTLLAAQKGEVNDQNRAAVARWFRGFDPQLSQLADAVDQHTKLTPQPKLVDAFVAGDVNGNAVYFLVRGEVDRKNGLAKPGFMQVLMNAPERDQHWLPTPADKKVAVHPRVGLAQWLTDSKQGAGHLLARVIVNRLWQHHLGRGLVATPNDFGTQGAPPTHPELLDYLANELIKNGWRLKPIHKLIVTSAVYLQGGTPTKAGLQVDPQNDLWGRRPPRRLEAEAIRDALLTVSGTLDRTMYGPGTLDENSPRRSVYLTVKRSQLVPFLQMFDAPEAIQSIAVRSSTTVATQALALMNAPSTRLRAEKLAQRIRPQSAEGIGKAVEEGYRTALSRVPTESERQRMSGFIAGQMKSYGGTGPALDRAMTDFCQVLLCLNEFIYVD